MTLKPNPFRVVLTFSLVLMISAAVMAQSDAAAPTTPPAAVQAPDKDKGHSDDAYMIGANDVLTVNVWKEPDISRSVPVRSDGKISLPLAGELQASGQTPHQLEQEITKRLQSYISDPEVTVIVTESKSQKINILGMVSRPGTYLLSGSTTVLDAIAMTGGFKDFAKQKAIYILRSNPDGTQKRFPFNYKEVIKGKSLEQNIRLLPGDTVIVP
ncbi:MAG: polysaccharide biosynthesis/export family protein [Acidobacteria bacterium]|nr:polysaccharide biosynthesis/export family protein [Acidobacteriota bacterium]